MLLGCFGLWGNTPKKDSDDDETKRENEDMKYLCTRQANVNIFVSPPRPSLQDSDLRSLHLRHGVCPGLPHGLRFADPKMTRAESRCERVRDGDQVRQSQ